MRLRQSIVVGILAVSIFGMATIVQAKRLEGILSCGTQQYTVSGYGSSEVLQISGSTTNYVVSYARVEPNGPVVIEIKGQQDKADLITCTTTSPATGNNVTLKGFFTPRGAAHEPQL